MSVHNTVRSAPGLLRASFAGVVAYRAEMVVWLLAATMPLVMLALWSAAAAGSPVGHFDRRAFAVYFLAMLVIRQLTESWACWHVNMEVRDGTLGVRLLRPVHPLAIYVAENLAELPFRALVALPAAVAVLGLVGTGAFTHDPWMWAAWVASMLGAWLMTLLFGLTLGCLAFFTESSVKAMEAWLVGYFVLSGYMIPIDLFPAALGRVVDLLPFRYQLGLPVEIVTGAHDRAATLALLARQWTWVAVALGATALTWRRGVRRFAAYGG
jgi:ABC-2 type transport system permease protein